MDQESYKPDKETMPLTFYLQETAIFSFVYLIFVSYGWFDLLLKVFINLIYNKLFTVWLQTTVRTPCFIFVMHLYFVAYTCSAMKTVTH